MNIEIFIRNVQLAKLGIGELDRLEKNLYDFLTTYLSDLKKYVPDKYPNNIYFDKSKYNILFKYDSQSQWLYVNYGVWNFLNKDLNIRYIDVPKLISWWVEATFGFKTKHIESSFFTTFTEDETPSPI